MYTNLCFLLPFTQPHTAEGMAVGIWFAETEAQLVPVMSQPRCVRNRILVSFHSKLNFDFDFDFSFDLDLVRWDSIMKPLVTTWDTNLSCSGSTQ